MTTKTLALNNIERKFFWTLSLALVVVLSFYLYSAFVITLAGVDSNNINRQARELSVASGLLEAEYLTEMNNFTLEYAKNLGFYEVNAKFTTSDNGPIVALVR